MRRARLTASGAVGIAAIVVFTFAVGPATIDGDSMAPTLSDGSLVVVDRLTHRLDSWPNAARPIGRVVDRGDVVLVRSPIDPTVTLVKRVVATPGDRVVFDDFGHISIGADIPDSAVARPGESRAGFKEVLVASGTYFVVGDNHLSSTDSRRFGCVRAEAILGRVRFAFWPLGAFGVVR